MGTTVLCMLQSGGVCGRSKEGFKCAIEERDAAQELLHFRQGSCSVADYAVDFRTLAAESAWNPEALVDSFLPLVLEEVKDELAARELPTDLDSLISLTIRIDGRLRERRKEWKGDFSRLSKDSKNPRPPDLPRESPKTAHTPLQEPSRNLSRSSSTLGPMRAQLLSSPMDFRALDGRSIGRVNHNTTPINLRVSGNHSDTIQFLLIKSPESLQ